MRLMVTSSAARSRTSLLPFVDHPIGARVVQRDGGVGGQVFQQAKVLLGVSILLEALNAEHAQNALLRDEGQIDHRGGRLGHAAVFEFAHPHVGSWEMYFFDSVATSLIRTGLRLSIHQTAN